MILATWNVNSVRVRTEHILKYLDRQPVDVLCLQELKATDEVFPHEAIQEAGYPAAVHGQKTYNGVAVLSREEGTDPVTDIPGLDDPQRRILAVTVGGGTVEMFRQLGVQAVVVGGQTMNPSTEELLAAAEQVPATEVMKPVTASTTSSRRAAAVEIVGGASPTGNRPGSV